MKTRQLGSRVSENRVLEMAWLFIVVAVPLAINPWGAQVFELPKVALLRSIVILMFAVWLWRLWPIPLARCTLTVRMSPLDPRIWAVAFSVVMALTTFLSIDFGLSLWGSANRQEGLYTSVAYQLLFLIVATELRNKKQIERLILTIALGSIPITVYGLLQAASLDLIAWESTDKSGVLSTLGRSNFVGSYSIMSIPLSAVAVLIARRLWQRGLLAISAIGSMCLLIVSMARSAWLAALIVVLVIVLGRLIKRQNWLRIILAVATVGLVAIVGAVIYLSTAADINYTLLGFPALPSSLAARLLIWRATLDLIAERPILGFGLDTFGLAFFHVFPPQLVFYQGRDLVTDRAHNVFLQQAATTGLLGTAAHLVLIATILLSLYRGLRMVGGRDRVVLIAVVTAVIGHLADLLFSIEVASTASVFWAVAGGGIGFCRSLTEKRQREDRELRDESPRNTRPTGIIAGEIAAAALALVLATNVLPLVADIYVGKALHPGTRFETRLANAEQAVALWPLEPSYRAFSASIYLQGALNEIEPHRLLAAAESRMTDALAMRPLDPLLWLRMADVLTYRAVRAADDSAAVVAENAYRRAIDLAPNVGTLWAKNGAFDLLQGRPDSAIVKLERATALDPTDGVAWSYLSQAYRAMGRTDEADVALSIALQNPRALNNKNNR